MKHSISTLVFTLFCISFSFAQSGEQSISDVEQQNYTYNEAVLALTTASASADLEFEAQLEAYGDFHPGKQMRQQRMDRGVSLDRLSAATGLSVDNLEAMESGQSVPTRDYLVKIQEFLEFEIVMDWK